MKKIVICFLVFGLYALQTAVGYMNTDPAPGRSPGPPAVTTLSTDTASVTNSQTQKSSSQPFLHSDPTVIPSNEDSSRLNATNTINRNVENYQQQQTVKSSHYYNFSNNYAAVIVNNASNKDLPLIDGQLVEEEQIHASLTSTLQQPADTINSHLIAIQTQSGKINEEGAIFEDERSNHPKDIDMINVNVDVNEKLSKLGDADERKDTFGQPELTYESQNDKTSSSSRAPITTSAKHQLERHVVTATNNWLTSSSTLSPFIPITTEATACRTQLSDFLYNTNTVIDANAPTNDTKATSNNSNKNAPSPSSTPQTLQIQLQLLHDVFDTETTTTFGINCGLMYKVRLSTIMPTEMIPATSSPVSTSSIPLFASASHTGSSLHHPRSATSPFAYTYSKNSSVKEQDFNTYLMGDFHVESVSLESGKKRGSFISETLGKKLPFSWFLTTAHQRRKWPSKGKEEKANLFREDFNDIKSPSDGYKGEEDAVEAPARLINHSRAIQLDETKRKRKREKYFHPPVSNKSPYDGATSLAARSAKSKYAIYTTTTTHTTNDTNDSRNSSDEKNDFKKCPDNKWAGKTKAMLTNDGYVSTESFGLWMLNELCNQEDVIVFRVFFRVKFKKQQKDSAWSDHGDASDSGNASSPEEAQQDIVRVYKKSFQFRIRNDCQLMLKETLVGNLDYTMLPLYGHNCTIYFPLYEHLNEALDQPSKSNTEENSASPGLLVELQRLNVPCDGRGYVRFLDRTTLCGKLEDLNVSDRVYHFDVRHRTSVELYRNPMFSLSFKLVDYCYNVSTNEEQGEFYVRPTSAAALECYFRIHLPYGNRILLRLVTNNDSSILSSTSKSFQVERENGYDAHMIFNNRGVGFNAEVINLTLGSALNVNAGYNVPTIKIPSFLTFNPTALKEESPKQNFTRFALNAFNSPSAARANLWMGLTNGAINCVGISINVFERGQAKWSYCVNSTKHMRGFLLESSSNELNVHLFRPLIKTVQQNAHYVVKNLHPTIYLSYHARPVPEIIASCAFGWVSMQQFCVTVKEMLLTWHAAEQHCIEMGGHLVSIRNEQQQQIINALILNSPRYEDQNAYWVGGSDQSYEGDFRWSDGLTFQYTNWFPGWLQHGNYNKQPNDDGLSSQDCIELRRYFRTPLGVQTTRSPLTGKYMWNDRDCSAKNFAICERPMSDDSYRHGWHNDCNKTVSLTKEHPRASVWSPSFPRPYPDNANCFTTVTAPNGYRIVVEFEELVVESEPGCTYDYLEILEPSVGLTNVFKSSSKQHNNNNNILNVKSNANSANDISQDSTSNYNLQHKHALQQDSSSLLYEGLPQKFDASLQTNIYNMSYNNGAYNDYGIDGNDLLNMYSSLYGSYLNFVVKTPDYPHGNPYYEQPSNDSDAVQSGILPQRLCGDWSTKLKLLRYVSTSSFLGLHFVSDYSHHFGGYKAKTYMENRSYYLRAASECANERLKPYNGSCYLFVSYPEVDWWTAQQVCRGMGATLTSISSLDEHRFLTSNIRNQIDYSPQLIYWMGAELEKNGQFEWTDGSKMTFQGWLPGQGQFDVLPSETICLGLQWKMSPTPMLPSGLYWQAQKCNKVGGYVCKKTKDSSDDFQLSNFTITGTEGRLMSPGYPNAYPLNVDYWIHIKAPKHTRVIIQFQKIDLESQDECLYDYISIQDYNIASKLILEPGVIAMPMAMLTSEEQLRFNEKDEDAKGSEGDSYYGNGSPETDHFSFESDPIADNKENTFHRNLRRRLRSYTEKTKILTLIHNSKLVKRSSRQKRGLYSSVRKATALSKIHRLVIGDTKKRYILATTPKRNRVHQQHWSVEGSRINNNKHRSFQKVLRQSSLDRENKKKMRKRKRSFKMNFKRTRRSTIVGDDDSQYLDNAQSFLPYVRWCGTHDSNMSKFDFVSTSNEVILNFHSDYSTPGLGFAAIWKAVDISACPLRTLTSREGFIQSPNYPHFLLNNLNCILVIQAPVGRRVWLEFLQYDFHMDSLLEVDIGNGFFRPFQLKSHLNDGMYVSLKEQVRIQFRTGQHPRGKGFQARYHTVGQMERRERIINLTNNNLGHLYQLNYPHDMPENVDYVQHIMAPFGHNILLELRGVEFSENGCQDHTLLEVFDNYADINGTRWMLCNYQISTDNHVQAFSTRQQQQNSYRSVSLYEQDLTPPIYITSYLNTLYIRQRTTANSKANLNCTVRLQLDNDYKMKLASGLNTVESCYPNPCQYNGKCLISNGSNYCQCHGHYTGRFCGLNLCELEPCVFGKCELTPTNFKCKCQPGYMGLTCEQKQRPCRDNPCEGRGICHEKNGGFFCRCYAWWEGQRCEKRILHIPYKPLSERMFQEPFWLGLITVFVVLAVIGLVWCAKRHFPEKIEKLLAEEADRNRPPGSTHGHHHHTSLREQLQFTSAIPQTTINNAPGATRSIFNILGIRKPSILSLSSPNPLPGGGGAAARTFSLDDLLRPPPRRSPSPRKKRNNSTPVKKNAVEKKQILQHLVSPAAAHLNPKVSLSELISLSENRLKARDLEIDGDLKETEFLDKQDSLTSVTMDPKLEKKVTFARLLSKVSAEMSSSSEPTRNSSALSLPTDFQMRASSNPTSPCTNDIRSSQNSSYNRGSDSLSSSDLALTDFGLRSIQTSASEINSSNNHLLNSVPLIAPIKGRISGSPSRSKVSSADSILAMFRNLATAVTTASDTAASLIVSASPTPTILSPQDDMIGDDESSTSSTHTPISFTSGPSDSPLFYRQRTTIEVPVLDALNVHKSSPTSSSASSSSSANTLHPPTILLEIPSSGINNKCLSPIREMPTPIPSPALTPIMSRPQRSNSPIFQRDTLSDVDTSDDENQSDTELSDNIVINLPKKPTCLMNLEVELPLTETNTSSTFELNQVKQANLEARNNIPKICLTPAAGSIQTLVPPQCNITIDVEPPTPDEKQARPRDLIIPTLTVEQPSPTKSRQPMLILPGSPPPQRASIGETSFIFPNKQQRKRLLKQLEKPTALEYPFAAPTITVTSNMSELESDTEPLSPAIKMESGGGGLVPPNPVGMTYLSPFAICTRADRTISESNLSSSGYSSMASPGPSRCGSNNPLYPNEMDEPGSGHSSTNVPLHMNLLARRRNSMLPSCKENITNGKSADTVEGTSSHIIRLRSDSETFSDEILLESNDEGIGTDHVHDKLKENQQTKRVKETEVLIEVGEASAPTGTSTTSVPQMAQLQLPSIVIQIDSNGEKALSPVSSRSESPLSERASMRRYSPNFYGHKDQLPFTDSDGLYDFPSSDGKGTSAHGIPHQRRSNSKKRERKSSKCSATQSPTKQINVPLKESVSVAITPSSSVHTCTKHCYTHHHTCPAALVSARKSPKRRLHNRYPKANSSSSSESLSSTKELNIRQLPKRFNSPGRDKRRKNQESFSEDDVSDTLLRRASPSLSKENEVQRNACKINRLRAIGNQIRFLRRLEKSMKSRDRVTSPTDSCTEENTDDMDSPQASSPLLQQFSPNKTTMALCRQKRTASGTYGVTAAALNSNNWKGMDRNLIGDDLNSD